MCSVLSLRKADKLRKNKKFQAVYKGGKSVSNRLLVLYMLPNQSNCNKIGFAAGKRLGNAVIRNRVKRMMREAFRLNRDKLPAGYDFILVGRQPVVGVKAQEVISAFLNLSGRMFRTNAERQ
jgi:ribonuclease P protein component